jgi:hypothetical protein
MKEGEAHANAKEEVTFGFLIVDPTTIVQMKNIPPSTLPHFHGMVSEDPDAFLFEFDILCHSYDYSDDAQKLKIVSCHSQRLSLALVYGIGRKHNSNMGWNA